MKIKFTWKIWLWLAVLILALISVFITPNFLKTGIIITSVEQNSTEFDEGLRAGQIITKIDNFKINSVDDFSRLIQDKFPSNKSIKTILESDGKEIIIYSLIAPKITVSEIRKTNLRTGLDLMGGSKALVQAQGKKLSSEEVNDLVQITQNRLNEFGLTDLKVTSVSDLQRTNYYMSIEVAGATPKDLEKLISEQGKFEAKIKNKTVFFGGKKDITSVSRSGQESGIYSCDQSSQGYSCNFRFSVYLSEGAAEKFAEVTKNLSTDPSNSEYLLDTIDFYLDDNSVSNLKISEGLKGRVTTQVSVSGFGRGATRDEAINNANTEMRRLQTVLITGSLPYKLEIIKLDTISPMLGEKFTKYILVTAVVAFSLVAIIVFVRYHKFKLIIPPLLISTSEMIITLGVAVIIGQDLDLPGIAGILAAIGTGIDDQIVVLDEAKTKEILTIKQKIKRAFTIILGAYFTVVVSLLPLLWAGAGLLKGFAIMSLIGITFGVLITRPAFADIIKSIEE